MSFASFAGTRLPLTTRSPAKQCATQLMLARTLLCACLSAISAPATAAPPQMETSLAARASLVPYTAAPPQPNPFHTLPTQVFTVLPFSRTIAGGDLNGDGKLDFVVAPSYFSWRPELPIQIWLNDGAGGFTDGTTSLIEGAIPTTGSVNSIFIRDFNGDGRPDILIIDQGLEDTNSDNPGFDGALNKILLSQPNGRLIDATGTSFPGQPRRFNHVSAIGDIDGDGSIDIALANLGGPRLPPPGVVMLLNDGRGVFGEVGGLPADYANHRPGTVQLADLDGDGALELISASYTYGDAPSNVKTLRIAQRNSAGDFVERRRLEPPAALSTFPIGAGKIVAADMDGDGRVDLAVVWESTGTTYMQFLRNEGNLNFSDMTLAWFGRYEAAITSQEGKIGPFMVELRDVNGDGTPDLLLRFFGHVDARDIVRSASVYLNDGTGRLTPWTWQENGVAVTEQALLTRMQSFCRCTAATVVMADVDGDGTDDVVLINERAPTLTSRRPCTREGLRWGRSSRPLFKIR
jgi:hypothetical protein